MNVNLRKRNAHQANANWNRWSPPLNQISIYVLFMTHTKCVDFCVFNTFYRMPNISSKIKLVARKKNGYENKNEWMGKKWGNSKLISVEKTCALYFASTKKILYDFFFCGELNYLCAFTEFNALKLKMWLSKHEITHFYIDSEVIKTCMRGHVVQV